MAKRKALFIQYPLSKFLEKYPFYLALLVEQMHIDVHDTDYYARFCAETGELEVGYLSDKWHYTHYVEA